MNNIIIEWLKDLENNNVQKLDFTKKEDLEKLENSIKTLRENSLFNCFFEDSVFDTLLAKAKKIYNDAHKQDLNKQMQPVKPSTNVNNNVKNNCFKLANEYVNKMIVPYINTDFMTPETKKDMIDALYEYGCWIYQK